MKIAIVGAACRLPGGVNSLSDLWELLITGRDGVTQIPESRFDVKGFSHPLRSSPGRSCTFKAGVVNDLELFDYSFFGISKKEAEYMDPQHRMMLEMAWEVLEDAHIKPSSLSGTNASVFVGSSSMDASVQRSDDPCLINPYTMIGNTLSLQANRISYLLDIHGPSMTLDTACSASSVALHLACQTLITGESSLAFAGGVQALLCPLFFIGFSKAHMLSKDGRCNAFGKDANGYVRAEGGGLVLLKPLDNALADGDRIHAVIVKTGVNSDGRTTGIAAPNRKAQADLLMSLYDDSALDLQNLGYIEAHGTGTSAGDPVEAGSLGDVFSQLRPEAEPLLIGSVKSNLGHLEPASGMAGLLKTLLVLQHKIVPPNLHLDELNPDIDFEGLGLHPVRVLTPLPSTPGLLLAGVNSFGFGGVNAHVLLQEAPTVTREITPSIVGIPRISAGSDTSADTGAGTPPLLLSARSLASLRHLASDYATLLRKRDANFFAAVAARAALYRDALSHRLVLQGSDTDGLVAALEGFADDLPPPIDSGMLLTSGETLGGTIRTVFLFSGNGGNWGGMGRALVQGDMHAARTLEALDACMAPLLGCSIKELMLASTPSQSLDRIELAQPLLFALQVCLVEALRGRGVRPDMVLGHSIGEVAAAYCCGALSLEQACLVIVARSQLQQETRGLGSMAVVQLAAEEAQALPQVLAGELDIAAVNDSRYVTLTGPVQALETLRDELKPRRLIYRGLELEHPFHSRFMDPLRERLLERLRALKPAKAAIPFYSTVTGTSLPGEVLNGEYWWRNIRQPVLFQQAVVESLKVGGRIFVELGPDALLQPFLKGCLQDQTSPTVYLSSLKKGQDHLRIVSDLWARIYAAGGRVDTAAMFPTVPPYVALPSYPWDREYCVPESTPESLGLFAAKPPAHPLLGHRVRRDLHVWEQVLDVHLLPLLGDHVVGGEVVMPGAAYLEMALAAAWDAYKLPMAELENVELRQPMAFHPGKARVVRFTLSPKDGDFLVESREQMESGDMTLHAVGRIIPHLDKTLEFGPELPLDNILANHWGEPQDLAVLYAKGRDAGLAFGPSFQPMQRLWKNDDEAVVQLDLAPKAAMSEAVLHPVLIDGGFQTLLALVDWAEKGLESFLYIPIRMGQLRMLRSGRVAWAHARLKRQSTRSCAASFCFYNEQGRELARLEDCRFARIQTRVGLLRQQHTYSVMPVPVRHPLDASPSPWPPLAALTARLAPALEALQAAPRWRARRQETLPFLTALQLSQTHAALQGMLQTAAAVPHTAPALLAQAGLPADREPWLRYCFGLFEDMGLAARQGDQWRLLPSDLPPGLELWREGVKAYPAYCGELSLLAQVDEALVAILRHKLSPQSLLSLLPGGPLEQLHRTSPLHLDAVAAARLLVKEMHRNLAPGTPVRILELDAGAGALAEALLPRLAPGSVEYLLTDRDEGFVEQLKARWRERPDVSASLFNPEDCDSLLPLPAQPGLDIVLLCNTLHRLSDLPHVLGRLKAALRPGGIIVALDLPPHPIHDLLFGLLADWWREDASSPAPRSRLLTSLEWKAALEQAGFESPVSLLDDSSEGDILFLAAQVPAHSDQAKAPVPAERTFVLLEDVAPSPVASALAARLEAALTAADRPCVRVAPCPDLNPEDAGDWERLLTQLGGKDATLECVHLMGLDAREDLTPDVLDELQNRRVITALALAQGWQRSRVPANLCLVTGGGIPLDGYPSRLVPSQGALPGLGRVLINEMGALQVRLVDMHADTAEVYPLDAAVQEILSPAGTDDREIILSGAARFCLRLAPTELAAMALPPAVDPAALALRMEGQGHLEGARWRETILPSPESGMVLVENKAAGVNYRDIMFTLGRIPDEALENGASGPTLGLECVGTVLAVGEGVSGFSPGDTVCCLGGGLYDSHVLVAAETVFPVPQGMLPSEAASIPVAYFTAWYALTHLARIQPGERVLIHGAAGGVGLAAVRIATCLKAEVFATAGSPAKRTFLRRLGVPHVFNSRSLDFEGGVLDCTAGQGVDVVLNSISGEALSRSMHLLRPLGRFLELGKVDFYTNSKLRMRVLKNNISFFGIDVDQVMKEQPSLCRRLFLEMLDRFACGDLWPIPHILYPHASISEAFRCMQQSRHLGKLVVEFEELAAAAQRDRPAPIKNLPADATYLVTGGLGGLGLVTAKRLVALGARCLVLLSRSGTAKQPQQDAVEALRLLGVRIETPRVDVADADALARDLAPVLAGLPPVRGVMHCAGVLRDAAAVNLTPDDVRTVLRAKALGGWNLHRFFKDNSLDFFVMFSSATTVLGNPGQANYVAANTMLECLAGFRRAQGLPATCFGWGPVADVGMLTERQNILDSLTKFTGAQPLRAEVALDFVERLSFSPLGNIHVFKFDFKKLSRLPYIASGMYRFVIGETVSEQAGEEHRDIREILQEFTPKDAVMHLVGLLTQQFANILRVPASRVRRDTPLSDLGMDSLMYVELGLATEELVGIDISSLSLDKTSTILTLSEMLYRQLNSAGSDDVSQAELVIQHANTLHGLSLTVEDTQRLLDAAAPSR